MLLDCENRPIDAAAASCVQPGCVGAEGTVTWNRVKHFYYNQQVIGLSLWQCYSLYSAWYQPSLVCSDLCRGHGSPEGAEAKVSPLCALHGCRKSMEQRRRAEAIGFRCVTPKVVQRLSLSCVWRLWPFTEEHLWAVHGPIVMVQSLLYPTVTKTQQELDNLPTKSGENISMQ